jgi:hypothetical protein
MQMKQLVIVFFFLLQYVSAYGQGKITGIIVDSLTQKPIEYVNISLYQKGEGKFTAGVITDMSGIFVIDDVAYNEYILKYRFIGYDGTGFKEIRMDKNNPVVDLGIIELMESPHLLDEVEVTAGRSRFVAKIDRKVFHAGGDLISSSGSKIFLASQAFVFSIFTTKIHLFPEETTSRDRIKHNIKFFVIPSQHESLTDRR